MHVRDYVHFLRKTSSSPSFKFSVPLLNKEGSNTKRLLSVVSEKSFNLLLAMITNSVVQSSTRIFFYCTILLINTTTMTETLTPIG